jgi:hypothetical protein
MVASRTDERILHQSAAPCGATATLQHSAVAPKSFLAQVDAMLTDQLCRRLGCISGTQRFCKSRVVREQLMKLMQRFSRSTGNGGGVDTMPRMMRRN